MVLQVISCLLDIYITAVRWVMGLTPGSAIIELAIFVTNSETD